ncbi:MAG TPA: VOC family protein [Anaerolineae bacterium]|jgi:catechol 2,3-dioxygenase|nr:VOC family protein [Anaerolineae bacterium]
MTAYGIHPKANVGCVCLTVQDLPRSLAFYTGIIGLRIEQRFASGAHLGAGGNMLLRLVENPLAQSAIGTAGLYHFAILVPSRLDLARSLRHLLDTRTPLQGFADHLVSEAIYLADPDGNGIEIYRDRPRDRWPRRDGQLLMATDPLDVNSLLDELNDTSEDWIGLGPGTTIGHIHLRVSDLEEATAYYEHALGFDLVLRYGLSAAFLSAGGYHHHIGCNTWSGVGVPPAPADAVGLRWFSIDLPDAGSYEECVQKAKSAPWPTEERDDGLLVRDPSGNGILLRVRR